MQLIFKIIIHYHHKSFTSNSDVEKVLAEDSKLMPTLMRTVHKNHPILTIWELMYPVLK